MTVATFIAIKNAKQSRGSMAGAMGYVAKDDKTIGLGFSLVVGHNCLTQSSYIELVTRRNAFTKQRGGNSIISSNPLRKVTGFPHSWPMPLEWNLPRKSSLTSKF